MCKIKFKMNSDREDSQKVHKDMKRSPYSDCAKKYLDHSLHEQAR